MLGLKKGFCMRPVVTGVFLILLPLAAAAAPVKPEEAELYAGRIATVEGTAHVSKPNTGTVTFVEIAIPGNAATVTGIIYAGDEPQFPHIKDYDGTKVDITGVLQHFKGTLRIVLRTPDQIKSVP